MCVLFFFLIAFTKHLNVYEVSVIYLILIVFDLFMFFYYYLRFLLTKLKPENCL